MVKTVASGKRELWNNYLLPRYRNLRDEIEEDVTTEKLWEMAQDKVQDDLEEEVNLLDKLVDGNIYLIGTMQMNNEALAASRPLGTNNVGKAIKTAVDAFKGDKAINVYVADGELVISVDDRGESSFPSVFSFRCVPEGTTGKADELVDLSTSVAPLVKRIHRWKK